MSANTPRRHRRNPLGKQTRHYVDHTGEDYTDAEKEFLWAVQELKRRHPHPTDDQLWQLLVELDYPVPRDAFLRAVKLLRRQVRFPTWVEYLTLVVNRGWGRKGKEPTP